MTAKRQKNLSCALNALRRSLAYLVENNIKLGGVFPLLKSTNVDAIYNAISGDDDRIKEFFESLCFTEKDNPREFVRVLDDFQDFRHLPNSIGDYAADEFEFREITDEHTLGKDPDEFFDFLCETYGTPFLIDDEFGIAEWLN